MREWAELRLEQWGAWNRELSTTALRSGFSALWACHGRSEQPGFVPPSVQQVEIVLLGLMSRRPRYLAIVRRRYIKRLPQLLIAQDLHLSQPTVSRRLDWIIDFVGRALQSE